MKMFKAAALMALVSSSVVCAAVDPVAQMAQLGDAFSDFAQIMEMAKHVEENEASDLVIAQCVNCKCPATNFGFLSIMLMCKACLALKEGNNGLNAFTQMQPLFKEYVALSKSGTLEEKQGFAVRVGSETQIPCNKCGGIGWEAIPASA